MKKSLLVLFLMAAAALAGTPAWVTSGKSAEYPTELYFVGTGISSKSLENAREQAVAEIAKQVSVGIKATTVDIQSEETFGSRSISSYEKAESRIRMKARGELEGVAVVETAQKQGRHYALAILDKKKFASAKKTRINELRKEILATLESARKAASSGRIIAALQGVRSIRVAASEILSQRKLLSAAEAITEEQAVPVNEQDLYSLMEKCVSSLRFQTVSGNRQSFKIGGTLPEPWVVKLLVDEKGKRVPVPGVALAVKDGEGKTLLDAITRSDGIAEIFPAEAVGSAGVGRNEFEVEIRLPVSASLKRQLRSKSQFFRFEVIGDPTFATMELVLPKSVRAAQRKAEAKMWKILGRSDIREKEGAPGELGFQFTVEEQARARGVGGDFVQVVTSAECELKINGSPALEFGTRKAKGMGSSLEKAFLQSMENLKLAKKIPELVGKLRGARAKPKPRLAVFGFQNSSAGAHWHEVSQTLTGMLITGLIQSRRFDVVERQMLERIMEEKKLGMMGVTDMSEDLQVAQLAGAQYLVVGSVTQHGNRIEADARLVNVGTGKAIAAANGSVGSREHLRGLATQLVSKLKSARLD